MSASRSEWKWVILWALAIVLLSSVPYIIGIVGTPPGYKFLGLTHNIDDGAVYLSWTRQAADGHFFIRNLFTNEPQAARQFNVLFLLMGNFARFTGISVILVYHIFRCLLSVAFFLVVYKFAGLFLDTVAQRRLLIPIVGLSSGIGWLLLNVSPPTGSVDMWQPEAITFLSIYLNPLFIAALILMIGSMYYLVRAQREGRVLHTVFAGLLLLLLGNVHTYDIITIGCIWASYIFVLWATERKFPTRVVCLSALAAVIALPSVAYQYHLYSVDSVFRARANSPTPSPAIWSYFMGYGLILAGALFGAFITIRSKCTQDNPKSKIPNPKSDIPNPKLLLLVWSVVGFIVPYIPVGQQRKLIMGIHIPLCILCVVGLTWLLDRISPKFTRVLVIGLVVLSMGSNLKFIAVDANQVSIGQTAPGYAPYISKSELAAMKYLREHAKPDVEILAPPSFALFTPAFTGRSVIYGHWSETPHYAQAISYWQSLQSESSWTAMPHNAKPFYYVSEDRRWDPPAKAMRGSMHECFRDGEVKIYLATSSF